MPTFDFQCRKCKAVFEASRPFGKKINPPCPKCGSKRTEKLLTPPAIQFKGSGFYKTDNAKHVTEPKKKPTESAVPPEKKETAPATDTKK